MRRAVVFSMASTPWCLAALCLVSQLPVWTRGALLRRLGHRRCECEFDSVPAEVLHPNSHVHCLSARGIEERIVSQSSTWLLVGKAGWLASGTRGRLICQLRQFGPPLCGPPYRRPPAESSHGSYGYERRLKLGSGMGWCEPERCIVATRWSLEAKERP